jgi:hypothetical protein
MRGLKDFLCWTWMAWDCEVSFNVIGLPQSLISCYRFRSNQLKPVSIPTITSFPTRDPDEEDSPPVEFIWHNENEYLVTVNDIPHNVYLQGNQVIFWAYVSIEPSAEAENSPWSSGIEVKSQTACRGRALIAISKQTYFSLELSWNSNIAKRERVLREDLKSYHSLN